MKLLLVRHGKAEERSPTAVPSRRKDAARALTSNGQRQMRRAAKGLRKLAPDIDILATSRLVRARQTAAILAKIFGTDESVELAALAPGGDRAELLAWCGRQPADVTIALVGHEPDLAALAAWLLGEHDHPFIEFKKGGACLIEFDGHAARGRGTLAWLLPPAALRRLAG